MLRSVGVDYVLVGHSERRHYCGETDEVVAAKVAIALANCLLLIFCCGESGAVRTQCNYFAFVENQLRVSLFHLPAEAFGRVAIAYEPLWAIGTGMAAPAAQAQASSSRNMGSVATSFRVASRPVGELSGSTLGPYAARAAATSAVLRPGSRVAASGGNRVLVGMGVTEFW
jgi:triosephosphate isomerase